MKKVLTLQISDQGKGLAEGIAFNQQKFPWGEAVWLTEPDKQALSRVTAGLITFYPFSSQPDHSHRREEQVLYVLSGQGEHMVDGIRYQITAGSYFHIRPHSHHVVYNNSAEDLRILVIYIYSPLSPFNQEMDDFKPWYVDFISGGSRWTKGEPTPQETTADPPGARGGVALYRPEPFYPDLPEELFDLAALKPVLDHLSQVLEVSISLLDVDGRYIFQAGNQASFCAVLASVCSGAYCQASFRDVYTQLGDDIRPHFFFCCHKIASIIIPIYYHGRIMAYLKCGEILLSTEDKESMLREVPTFSQRYALDAVSLRRAIGELPIEPKNRLYIVTEATMVIAKTIINQAESKQRQHEMDKSRLSLVQEQLAKASLEKALHESGLKLLQSQVNPHFMFNTLNTISHLAYLEGASKASALTRDLSELLRYTLRKSEQLIPLNEELALLHHYINIQKERFGDRIDFVVNVDEKSIGDLSEVSVPCMILQPLVENAIVHGLESRVEGGGIEICLRQDRSMIVASVRDNGCGFDPEEIRNSAENRVGLKSTRSRLRLHYGDNFSFSLRSAPKQGCEVTLCIPLAVPLEAPVHWTPPAKPVEG